MKLHDMPEPWYEVVGCTGKVPFPTRAKATAVATRKTVKQRPFRTAYLCAHCHQWHIGTDIGRVTQKQLTKFKERKNHDER